MLQPRPLGDRVNTKHLPARRDFLRAPALSFTPAVSPSALIVPVHQILDSRARFRPQDMQRFQSEVWSQAVRDFGRCGIELQTNLRPGEIRRSPGGQPVFIGFEHGVINFVITDPIPLAWDNGRGLAGVTTLYQRYHLCMIALGRAHGHQIPFISINTCIHELLHAFLHDIFESKPQGFLGKAREFRVDLYGTHLWLFRDGRAIREQAERYVDRLKSDAARLT